ncbi:MAG: PilZ domain-containing protein [Kiritimatiellae bacterium]|nr:PilZ domain-containing protein [Kiritimatiellia bacterium]MDD4735420.1 PilZ domain-containing protein [Kiritimatiellia bacterium]
MVDEDRNYMRHPMDIPIQYTIEDQHGGNPSLRNISKGGLCFRSDETIPVGSSINVTINLGDLSSEVKCIVAWVVEKGLFYEIGVKFDKTSDVFHFRLIEQLCSIAHYRHKILEKEGRKLTNEEAACEWINKYAATFPEV